MTKQCGWVLVFAFAFACFLGSDLMAAQAKGKGKPTVETKFKALDKNDDGKVTRDEYIGLKEGEAKAMAMKRFQKLDKNHDGDLTLDEYKAASAKKAPKKGKK
jgi:Ca2+-binding EF-hand superfamily protein